MSRKFRGMKLLKKVLALLVATVGARDWDDLVSYWCCWDIKKLKLSISAECVLLHKMFIKRFNLARFLLFSKNSNWIFSQASVTLAVPFNLLINLTALLCINSISDICLTKKGSQTSQAYSKEAYIKLNTRSFLLYQERYKGRFLSCVRSVMLCSKLL